MNSTATNHGDWIAFQRIQEVKSAARINLIRFVSVVLFFSILLSIYLGSERTVEQTKYLFSSARVCGIWLLVIGAVYIALRQKNVRPLLKYATSLCDVLLLVAIASAGAKAESNLVIVFFIITASTFLRFSNKLILSTTSLCILGYLALVYQTHHFWNEPNFQSFPALQVTRVVAALAILGMIGWQLCRGCRYGLETLVTFERLESDDE